MPHRYNTRARQLESSSIEDICRSLLGGLVNQVVSEEEMSNPRPSTSARGHDGDLSQEVSVEESVRPRVAKKSKAKRKTGKDKIAETLEKVVDKMEDIDIHLQPTEYREINGGLFFKYNSRVYPIKNESIQVNGAIYDTDNDGSFVIDRIDPGYQTFEAEIDGFYNPKKEVLISCDIIIVIYTLFK